MNKLFQFMAPRKSRRCDSGAVCVQAERGAVPHCKGVTRQGAAVGHVKLVCPDWANAVPAHIKIKNNSRFIISASREIEDACGGSCRSGSNAWSEMAKTKFCGY